VHALKIWRHYLIVRNLYRPQELKVHLHPDWPEPKAKKVVRISQRL
jgi:hypothetical protein